MTGCSTSSIADPSVVGGRAQDAPPSCTGAPRSRSLSAFPERSYELAGRLLAQAVTAAEGEDIPISDALRRTAREEGRSLGAKVLESAGSKGRSALRDATTRVLADRGYEPRHDSAVESRSVKLPLSLLGQGLHRPCLWDESRCDRRLAFFSRPNRIQGSARPRLGQVLRSTPECRGTPTRSGRPVGE